MELEDIDRLRAGDSEVWSKLVQTYHGLVFWVLKRANVPDSRLDDLSQDVWLRVFQGFRRTWHSPADNGRPLDGYLKAWIAAIASNCAIDDHRKDARRSELPLGNREPPAPQQDMATAFWQDTLSEHERRVIALYLQCKSVEEISTLLGESPATIYRTLRQLRDKLGADA